MYGSTVYLKNGHKSRLLDVSNSRPIMCLLWPNQLQLPRMRVGAPFPGCRIQTVNWKHPYISLPPTCKKDCVDRLSLTPKSRDLSSNCRVSTSLYKCWNLRFEYLLYLVKNNESKCRVIVHWKNRQMCFMRERLNFATNVMFVA